MPTRALRVLYRYRAAALGRQLYAGDIPSRVWLERRNRAIKPRNLWNCDVVTFCELEDTGNGAIVIEHFYRVLTVTHPPECHSFCIWMYQNDVIRLG
jgi:hypothetical protein